jgi:hypothetical protein
MIIAVFLALLCRAERLVEVADQVFGVFEADREAHHVGAGAGGRALFVGELAVSGRGRVQDQGAGVADIREVREEADALDQPGAAFIAALDPEGEDRAGAFR